MNNDKWTDELRDFLLEEGRSCDRDLWPALERELSSEKGFAEASSSGRRRLWRYAVTVAALLAGLAIGTIFIFNDSSDTLQREALMAEKGFLAEVSDAVSDDAYLTGTSMTIVQYDSTAAANLSHTCYAAVRCSSEPSSVTKDLSVNSISGQSSDALVSAEFSTEFSTASPAVVKGNMPVVAHLSDGGQPAKASGSTVSSGGRSAGNSATGSRNVDKADNSGIGRSTDEFDIYVVERRKGRGQSKAIFSAGLLADGHISASGLVSGKLSESQAQSLVDYHSYAATSVCGDVSSCLGSASETSSIRFRSCSAPLTRALYMVRQTSVSHRAPFTVGVTVNFNPDARYFVQSGLQYTLLHSLYTSSNYITSDVTEEHLREHYLGIPVSIGYRFLDGRKFSLYGMTGAHIDKCFSARLGDSKVSEKNLQFGALLSVGAEYRISELLNICLAPSMDWIFTKTSYETYWSKNPVGFNLRAGLSINFQ